MAKNKRQPYAVSEKAGEQTSAESWGTGQWSAVKKRNGLDIDSEQVVLSLVFLVCPVVVHTEQVRLPSATCADLVGCSLPPRSGESGIRRSTLDRSMCMFTSPGKVLTMSRRFAVASALAASSVPALLLARGHRISSVPEVPLVVSSEAVKGLVKTQAAVALLKAVGAGPDVVKVQKSRKLRAGKGKLRGRRQRQRRGPLVVYNPETDGKELVRAFRNIPGVETSPVTALNLLQLAPGGHLGRFIIWTSDAFKTLDDIYGSTSEASSYKKDFLLPTNLVSNADINRLINSSEIQSVLKEPKGYATTKRTGVQKKNPLKNRQVLLRLNPYAAQYSKDKIGQTGVEHSKPEPLAEVFAKTLHEN